MARLFATSINLNKNELQNARIQNLSSNPSSPVAGQIYFNTTDNELRYYDGSQWISGSSVDFGNTASRPASSKAGQIYVDTEATVIYVDNGTSWVQGTVSPDDVADAIGDHASDTTTHGVSGDIVGTSDTQTLSNKTISDNLHFQSGITSVGYIHDDASGNLAIYGTDNDVNITANNDVNIETSTGNIILNPDGHAYLYNNLTEANKIATIGDLNSSEVVQSVSGTANEVTAETDASGNVTVGLPDNVGITTALQVGNVLYPTLDVNGTTENVTINGQLNIATNAGANTSNIYTDVNNDLKISAFNNLILDHDSSGVFIGSSATGNKVVTEAGTADISNKRVIDTLYFSDGVTVSNEGEIAVRAITHDFDVQANLGDLNLKTTAANTDIVLTPQGEVVVDSQLSVVDNLNVTTIAGADFDSRNGSLTLQSSDGTSQIHINGTTKDIELLPASGSKAFYGSAATAGNEIARISDLQALSSGLSWKQAVNLLVDSNISDLTNMAGTYDGHAVTISDIGYRFLLTGQSTSSENGIYVAWDNEGDLALSRATDADSDAELQGAAVFVMEGTTYGSTSWVQNNHYVSSFANQEWVQFSGQGTLIGSDSIQIDGNQINAIVDQSRGLAIDGDGIYVNAGYGVTTYGNQVVLDLGTGFDASSGVLEFASGYGVRKYTTSIGDNSATSFNLDHNFDTRHVTVQIFEAASPYAQVEADVEHSTVNRVVVRFASAPTTGQYEVVIVG